MSDTQPEAQVLEVFTELDKLVKESQVYKNEEKFRECYDKTAAAEHGLWGKTPTDFVPDTAGTILRDQDGCETEMMQMSSAGEKHGICWGFTPTTLRLCRYKDGLCHGREMEINESGEQAVYWVEHEYG